VVSNRCTSWRDQRRHLSDCFSLVEEGRKFGLEGGEKSMRAAACSLPNDKNLQRRPANQQPICFSIYFGRTSSWRRLHPPRLVDRDYRSNQHSFIVRQSASLAFPFDWYRLTLKHSRTLSPGNSPNAEHPSSIPPFFKTFVEGEEDERRKRRRFHSSIRQSLVALRPTDWYLSFPIQRAISELIWPCF
jgi:hypothetical protein